MTTRRFFLRNAALAMAGAGTVPLWLERALYAADAPSPRKKILVAIFQRERQTASTSWCRTARSDITRCG